MPAVALGSVCKVLRLAPETFEEAVEAAARVLSRGGIVALPTDTLYGVSTLVHHSEKLFELKKRSHQKPLGLFVSSPNDISNWARQTISMDLAKSLLPGPVTLLFERKPCLPPFFNPDCMNVGIRVPDAPFVNALCKILNQPLAQTSANMSGSSKSPVCLADFEDLLCDIDLVIDGGLIGNNDGFGSTIIDLSTPNKYRIIRDGCARLQSEEKLMNAGLHCIYGDG